AHVVEAAVMEDGGPLRFIDIDVEEGGQLADFPREVRLQIGEVNQAKVGKIPTIKPALNMRPEWPVGIAVGVEPGIESDPHVRVWIGYWGLPGVECVDGGQDLGLEVGVVVMPAPIN